MKEVNTAGQGVNVTGMKGLTVEQAQIDTGRLEWSLNWLVVTIQE